MPSRFYDRPIRVERSYIIFPDGERERIKLIGKGMFKKVYVTTERKVPIVYALNLDAEGIRAFDHEILASICDNYKNRHIPCTELIGHTHNATVYEMKHYRSPLRKRDSPRAWRNYRILSNCWNKAWESGKYYSKYDGHALMNAVLECYQDSPLAMPSITEALELLISYGSNYGSSISFEFAPRNLATDKRGNLILLDALFDRETAEKIRHHYSQGGPPLPNPERA